MAFILNNKPIYSAQITILIKKESLYVSGISIDICPVFVKVSIFILFMVLFCQVVFFALPCCVGISLNIVFEALYEL